MPSRPSRPSSRGARPQASRAEVPGRPPAAALAGVVPWRQPSALEVLATGGVVALVMLVLDLTWLGVVAADLYTREMGVLKRPDIVVPAAAAFYVMYVVATVHYAVVGGRDLVDAGRRGASLGIVAYGTYDLTNWAVIAGWPVSLVPVDLLWGVALTTIVSVAGRATYEWFGRRGGR